MKKLIVLALALTACSTHVAVAPQHPSQVLAPLSRAEVRAALNQRRQITVARFLAYREAKVYPVNEYLPGYAHVWVDGAGHLCAAATMISGDWGHDASARVAVENRFVKLADVHDGPIADWMLTSGLAHHEIVAIQGAARFENGNALDLAPREPDETTRMHTLYVDVERQIDQLWDESLDEATDALMAHPALARALLAGKLPGPGRFKPAPASKASAPSRPSPQG
jgi:hypothetical protein